MTEVVEEVVSVMNEPHEQNMTDMQKEQVFVNTSNASMLDYETLHPMLMGKSKPVYITPDPSLLPKMGQVGYAIEQAIAELVDNSVDACIDLNRIGNIIVNLYGIGTDSGVQSLEVYDDGTGMTEQQAEAAVVLGKSIKTDRHIGKFGMGMKTACTFLGKRFVIETTTAEDDQATIIVYDENEFLQLNKWELKSYRVAKTFPHGTRIRIENLRVNLKGHGQGAKPGNRPIERTIRLLGRQHRSILGQDKLYITVNNEPLHIDPPEWDQQWSPVLQKIGETLVTGKRIYGIIGVAKDLNSKGTDYGFDLLRHGRIVKEYEKIGFTPHSMKRNVYGTIHLDDFAVTNNKMDFIRDSDDWIHLEAKTAEYFKPIQRAIDKWYDSKDPAAPSKHPKEVQAKYVLVREAGPEGKDEVIKWVMPGHTLVQVLAADGMGMEYKWVTDKPQQVQAENDAEDDTGSSANEGIDSFDGDDGPIVVKSETDVDVSSADTTVHQSTAPTHTAPIMPQPSVSDASGLDGMRPQATGHPTFDSQEENTENTDETEDRGVTFRFASATDFEGSLRGVQYHHHAEHDGATNLYQSSDTSELDGETVLDVVTNLDHPACPQNEAMRWYKHSVAEAVAEHLVRLGEIDCNQLVSTKSALLSSLLVE